MPNQLIGRRQEKEILIKALQSNEPEMVAVIGRRRVGKTFLIRKAYEGVIDLEFTGVQDATRQEQLENFIFILNRFAGRKTPLGTPKNWLEAFRQLITILEDHKADQPKTFYAS